MGFLLKSRVQKKISEELKKRDELMCRCPILGTGILESLMPCGVPVHVPHINTGWFSSGTYHCLQIFLYKVNPIPSMRKLPREVPSANQGNDFLIGVTLGAQKCDLFRAVADLSPDTESPSKNGSQGPNTHRVCRAHLGGDENDLGTCPLLPSPLHRCW